ncbi:succinylglutamate desuccinylase/aspartoacylase family protein [Granulicella cerasi]|uniref:Succinylglutamate desuccinylase/aspartoacylase family protein n=1 Tax=Granulicella cerasi TaxID=741063 RepID=A0ABW1ZAL6_9BACT|nr:M14 family metallopeptidase [Granulicella cerasi]
MAQEAKTITVGTAVALPGTVVRGHIPVTKTGTGGEISIAVIVINGAKPGPCLWIDACIHGDEPEGTLTCHTLAAEINPAELAGTLVLVPAMNAPAFEAGQRGNPLDTFSYDMNRIYPGRANGYLTERIAWAHAEFMKTVADYEISIHSGGAHSYLSETIFVNEDPMSVELAKAMGRGWELVLSAISPKGNPMATMLEAGKSGITVELGGRPATSPEGMRKVVEILSEAMRNVMRHYGMIAGVAHYPEKRWKGVQEALLAPASGVFVPAEGVACQKPMKKGDAVATIVDVWGDVVGTLVAPADGMIFGLRALPNVMTGEWCCFYGKTDGFRD